MNSKKVSIQNTKSTDELKNKFFDLSLEKLIHSIQTQENTIHKSNDFIVIKYN